VVGAKSVQQLISPALLEEESFAAMRASEEGMAQMDRLADALEREFEFLFTALAAFRVGNGAADTSARGGM